MCFDISGISIFAHFSLTLYHNFPRANSFIYLYKYFLCLPILLPRARCVCSMLPTHCLVECQFASFSSSFDCGSSNISGSVCDCVWARNWVRLMGVFAVCCGALEKFTYAHKSCLGFDFVCLSVSTSSRSRSSSRRNASKYL